MRHSGDNLNMVLKGFCSPIWPYAIMLHANSAPFFKLSLLPLNRIFWITQFHSIYNESDSLPGFLNTSLVFSIVYLCVELNTLFIRIPLSLYHSLIQEWFVPPFLWKFPLVVLSPKIKKTCFPLQLRKKNTDYI